MKHYYINLEKRPDRKQNMEELFSKLDIQATRIDGVDGSLIDYNKLQSLTSTYETLNLEPLEDKLKDFGWSVTSVDGHAYAELENSLQSKNDKPLCVIANTIKGKGVSFMEGHGQWHHKIPNLEEQKLLFEELK